MNRFQKQKFMKNGSNRYAKSLTIKYNKNLLNSLFYNLFDELFIFSYIMFVKFIII